MLTPQVFIFIFFFFLFCFMHTRRWLIQVQPSDWSAKKSPLSSIAMGLLIAYHATLCPNPNTVI